MICGWGTILIYKLRYAPVRLEQSVLPEEVRGSRCRKDCVPAAAPSLGDDTACWCAGCESGKASGKPGQTEQTTERSRTTETPEETHNAPLELRFDQRHDRHMDVAGERLFYTE